MRRIDNTEALRFYEDWKQQGHHVDPRLLKEINAGVQLYLFRIEDEATFLSLIWCESDPARLLTPKANHGRYVTLPDG